MPRDINDPEFIATMESIERRVKPSGPRPYTSEETAEKLLKHFAHLAEYWAHQPHGDDIASRCHGLVFSILSTLDGNSLELPAFDLMPVPHPEDKQYSIDKGENYYLAENVVSTALHELYHPIKRSLYPDPEPEGRPMHTEKERAIVLHAAVEIANEEGYSKQNKLDACHAVAKKVLGIFDGDNPGIPPMMVFPAPTSEFHQRQVEVGNEKWDHVIPLNRRKTSYGIPEDETLAGDYDIVRMRMAAAARVMFGEPEAA